MPTVTAGQENNSDIEIYYEDHSAGQRRPGCSTTTPTATTRSPAPSSTGTFRSSHPGPGRRQHHAVLADGHRPGRPVVPEEGTLRSPCRQPGSSAGPAPGRLHHVPRRDLPGPARQGAEGYPNLTCFREVGRGRPPAAWDEPEVFATAIRGAFQGAAL